MFVGAASPAVVYVMSQQPKVLIADGTPEHIFRLAGIFYSAGYEEVEIHLKKEEVLHRVREFQPDLLVLDLTFHDHRGFDILRSLPSGTDNVFLPVLVITSQNDHAAREAAMLLGATDFITHPYLPFDVVLRARNLIQTRHLHQERRERQRHLESEVAERTLGLELAQHELKAAQIDVIERLALVGEHHDDDTGAHTRRVAHTCRLIAQKLDLPPEHVELIFRAAPLHDVGKIGISDSILLKPGRLTPEEFNTMKRHCEIGARLLSNGRSDFLDMARIIALTHHERYDGTGYPQGLKGEEIPLEGRIVAVADVYDALTNDRPYKKAWPAEDARAEIELQSGRHFDPNIVRVFLELDEEAHLSAPSHAAELVLGA